jgi:hypothetical protein
LTKLGFIRKFWPKRFHKIDFSTGFTPSSFPTSVKYNADAPSDEPSGFFDAGDDDERSGSRGRPDFGFPSVEGFGQVWIVSISVSPEKFSDKVLS